MFTIQYKQVACPVCKRMMPQNTLKMHIKMNKSHADFYSLFKGKSDKEKARILYPQI